MNGNRYRALRLAEAGWAVLPLDGKRPVTPHGHLDATTDPNTIRRLWGDQDWNVGSPVPHNLLVLDVDPRNGGSVEELEQRAGAALPPTLEVISGRRDGGRHLYFMRPFERPYRGNIPQGIDVKTNGYMVMPPSTHPDTGKSYKWVQRDIARLPREVVALMLPRRRASRRTATGVDALALATWLRKVSVGERHDSLLWAASRLHEAGAGDRQLDLLIDAAEDIGFNPREARRVVESARKVVHR
ncbi:bifunctional DNA primase/polymerase [Clavibacter californiensis]|uniref:bifunctional DNA primase/polymerase n=1 Tax=Clavibacter californiensis TaxID=1401995 RepID=UPI0015F986BC|nr:bifunctional DNA primase/polymerase [Clavibacter californiensis]UKF78921.1 bifunctional DNA primase/polymerase [Clavibacter californiensis]